MRKHGLLSAFLAEVRLELAESQAYADIIEQLCGKGLHYSNSKRLKKLVESVMLTSKTCFCLQHI